MNVEKRLMLYESFMRQLRNETLWQKLSLSEKLHLVKQFRKIYENCGDGDIEIFKRDPEFLYMQIGKRGINRFKKINEFVDNLNKVDLSTAEKQLEFKKSMKKKIFNI